jgi:sec-independent protein translocase protein TatA
VKEAVKMPASKKKDISSIILLFRTDIALLVKCIFYYRFCFYLYACLKNTTMDLFAPSHIFIIALVVLLLFGGKKIPELMRGLGRGIREFKDAKDNVQREIEGHINDDRPVNTNNNASGSTPTKQVSSGSSVNN